MKATAFRQQTLLQKAFLQQPLVQRTSFQQTLLQKTLPVFLAVEAWDMAPATFVNEKSGPRAGRPAER